MARMLQALKNLEAKSAWPAAGAGVLSHLAEPPKPAPPPPRSVEPPPPPPIPAAKPAASAPPAPQAVAIPTPTPAEPKPLRSRSATRPATGPERGVRRTLSEPHRRQPLTDLAARLRQDAHQTGSRTMLLAGIGPDGSTHETALHVAALIAEEGGNILLIDADLARRQLSTDLDDLQELGLTDLTREGIISAELLQPTGFEGLSFLPAGTQRFADLENAADRLARSVGQLAGQFDLVLVDAGRVGEPSTATLARLSDATYVVVQLGTVEASQAQQGLRELRAAGARVLGCIATGAAT